MYIGGRYERLFRQRESPVSLFTQMYVDTCVCHLDTKRDKEKPGECCCTSSMRKQKRSFSVCSSRGYEAVKTAAGAPY